MQRFVSKFLVSPLWEHLYDLFDAETPEGHAAAMIVRRFCRAYNDITVAKPPVSKVVDDVVTTDKSEQGEENLDQELDQALE